MSGLIPRVNAGAYNAIFDKKHPIAVAFLGRSFSPNQIAHLAKQQSPHSQTHDEGSVHVTATADAARAVQQDLFDENGEGNAHVDTTAFISLERQLSRKGLTEGTRRN